LEKDYISTLEGALELVEALVNPMDDELSLEDGEKVIIIFFFLNYLLFHVFHF
jgi:hypothetical protein